MSANPASAMAEEDAADLTAVREGDGDAFARLMRRHQRPLAGYLWKFTRSPAELEELVHNTFVEAYLALHGYRGTDSFRAWLLTIATRAGFALWKQRARSRQRHEVPLESVAEPPSLDGVAADGGDENLERLAAAVARLSPRDRLVVTLMYMEERSVAETSALTGWSQSMVKVQAFRARARLRKILEAAGDG